MAAPRLPAVNGASGNHELGTQEFGKPGRFFMEVAFEAHKLTARSGAVSASFGGQRRQLGTGDLGAASQHRIMKDKRTGKEALVLRSGHVVNLGKDLPPEFIQVTRALVFGSLLQAAQSTKPGIVDIDGDLQQTIATAMKSDLDRQGLSFARPDFTSLSPWDL